jgi:hypothetical protein
MIQGVVTTQPAPVGVGWGNYVIAWLITYQGGDCELWRHVLKKCMESELCRKILELLPTIGYSLEKHKCYADLDDLNDVEPRHIEADQTKPPNNASTVTSKATNQTNHSKTKLHNRLDAYALLSLKTTPPFSLSSTPPT